MNKKNKQTVKPKGGKSTIPHSTLGAVYEVRSLHLRIHRNQIPQVSLTAVASESSRDQDATPKTSDSLTKDPNWFPDTEPDSGDRGGGH